ncbi:hypothetical protein [Funiculus sociatus]|nr:hypothetical protein [Trichocoleus sp. FACHB-832]MBD2063348.1 hypothetical protein [Trichocoleus sp. FACHB-6]
MLQVTAGRIAIATRPALARELEWESVVSDKTHLYVRRPCGVLDKS